MGFRAWVSEGFRVSGLGFRACGLDLILKFRVVGSGRPA